MQQSVRSSLRVKLIAPFVAGTLILTLLLASYTYLSARKAVKDATLLISEAKTSYTAESMTNFFKTLHTSLQNMVAYPQIVNVFEGAGANYAEDGQSLNEFEYTDRQIKWGQGDPARMTSLWMEDFIRGNNYYRDLLLVNREGVCIASSNESYLNNSYKDEEYVKKALQGIFSFDNYTIGRISKELSVLSAGPVDAEGEIAGALVVINDSPKLVNYNLKTDFDSQLLTTSILAPDGIFMAHQDRMIMGNPERTYSALYSQLREAGEKGREVTYSLDGQNYVGYAKLEPQTEWLVITSGLESEVYASAYKMGLVVLVISLIFLSTVSFVVIRVANGILSGLISLINYAKQVSDGDLNQQLGESSRTDELGILHDSLQRLVQALHQMLEETRYANSMKDQFLANMSHEMRTPLNAIISTAHLSLREGDLPCKQTTYLNRIQLAARSLLGVINDILDISKVEAGKLEMEDVPFNLYETISDTIAIHHENAASKGIELEVEYDENTPRFFIGDPLRISQVLNNLLSNALKFTKKGTVHLRCWQDEKTSEKACPKTSNEQWANIYISVCDTGVGIAPDVVSSLFQPFIQADASITRKYGGTGLGLAISDRLVQLMGGKFSLESTENVGSTFTFYMNLALAEGQYIIDRAEEPLSAAFENLGVEGCRILLAEDNEINQMIVEEFLEPTKVVITTVENGQEAVDAITRNHFDLVLMDMQMPVMDGLEATRIIRTLPNGKNVPIVAVTANAREEDKEKSLASGMDDFLTKPIDPDHLVAVLRKWIAERKSESI